MITRLNEEDVDKLLEEFNKIESAKEQCLCVNRNPLEATRIIWYLNAKAGYYANPNSKIQR